MKKKMEEPNKLDEKIAPWMQHFGMHYMQYPIILLLDAFDLEKFGVASMIYLLFEDKEMSHHTASFGIREIIKGYLAANMMNIDKKSENYNFAYMDALYEIGEILNGHLNDLYRYRKDFMYNSLAEKTIKDTMEKKENDTDEKNEKE